MRIVVINATTDLYGANRILSLALQAFPKHANVQLFLPDLSGPLTDFIGHHNPSVKLVLCESLPIIQRKMFSPSGVMQAFKLLKDFNNFLKQENDKDPIDLIYINTLSNFLVIPIAKRCNINTMVHVHEILESPKFVSNLINKFTLKWGGSIIAVSEAVKRNLVKSNPSTGNKVTVIHNGIPDLINGNRPSEGCMITLIARIKPEKGIWYFLEAVNQLKNLEKVSIRIIGGPAPYGEKYVAQLQEDIKESKALIEYISFTPQVQKFLNETDILVVPSIMKDPFPTTVLEGMSCGKAVVATDTGGAAEAIIDKESGILIKNNDSVTFAKVLEELIENPEERKRLGENARNRYLSQFSIDSYREKMSLFIEKQL